MSFSSFLRFFSCFLLFIVLSVGVVRAESGIVVWKEQHFHHDERARAFAFDEMHKSPEITWFSKGARRMGFEKHQFFQYILLPPLLPAELAEPEQIDSYRHQLAELDVFAKRFPSAAAILKPQLEVMRSANADYEAGQVYFSGEWMPRADYKTKVAVRVKLLREKAAQRKAEQLAEARRREAEQLAEARRREAEQLAEARRREAERRAMELEEGRKYAFSYVAGLVVYLILLVGTLVRRMRRLLVCLILVPLLAAGWMTYQHGGHGWIRQHAEKISHAWKSTDAP